MLARGARTGQAGPDQGSRVGPSKRRSDESMTTWCERARTRGAARAARLLALIKDLGKVAAARHHPDSPGQPRQYPANDPSSEMNIESLVLDPEWGCLFTEEEKALAISRLRENREP